MPCDTNCSSCERCDEKTLEHPRARDPRSSVAQLHLSSSRPGDPAAREPFACERCGERIGVYEPLVMYTVEGTRTTSRAAEPYLLADEDYYYHRDCYAAWGADQAPVRVSASHS
jgi:hypothetical protein